MYAQRTADGRIALGGRGVPYRFGSAIDQLGMTDPSTVAALAGVCAGCFPPPPTRGSRTPGAACSACRATGAPRSPTTRASGLGWAGGYTGHGVAASNLAGRTLADLVAGERVAADRAALGGAPQPGLGA